MPARRASAWRIAPWLYLAPAAVTLILWIYWPLLDAFRLSFFRWNMLPGAPMSFVGWTNYQNILALPKFWQALRNTGLYILCLVPLAVSVPTAVAIYTHDLPARSRNIYRAIIFVPMIIAPVVAAAIWRWLLDPGHGMVNEAITLFGFRPVRFLQDPSIAIWTIIVLTSWKLIGFSTLILSAANANINPSLIEAARILREEHEFRGYIHLKTIPEADPELVARAGLYADRVSINVELPTQAGLARLAPDMLAFTRQIQLCCDFAKNAVARLSGGENPRFPDEEKSFPELKERIAKTLAFVDAADSAALDAGLARARGQRNHEIVGLVNRPRRRRHLRWPQIDLSSWPSLQEGYEQLPQARPVFCISASRLEGNLLVKGTRPEIRKEVKRDAVCPPLRQHVHLAANGKACSQALQRLIQQRSLTPFQGEEEQRHRRHESVGQRDVDALEKKVIVAVCRIGHPLYLVEGGLNAGCDPSVAAFTGGPIIEHADTKRAEVSLHKQGKRPFNRGEIVVAFDDC